MPTILHSAGDTFGSIIGQHRGEGPGFAVLRLDLAGRQTHSELVRIVPKPRAINLETQKAKRNAVIHSRIRSRRSDADTRHMGARPPVAHKSRETRATNLGRLTPAMGA